MTKYKKHTVTGKQIGGPLLKRETFETIKANKLTLKASKKEIKDKKFLALAEDDQENEE